MYRLSGRPKYKNMLKQKYFFTLSFEIILWDYCENKKFKRNYATLERIPPQSGPNCELIGLNNLILFRILNLLEESEFVAN